MAGGKETPRQKMIGMMYLVLTALLALNVSKEVIAAFVTINDKLDASSTTIHLKSEDSYAGFDKKRAALTLLKGDLTEFNTWQKKADELKAETQSIVSYILSEANEMIKEAEGEDWIEEKNDANQIVKLKPLIDIENMDNYDIPTYFFVGSDPKKPNERGLALIRQIHHYRDMMSKLMSTYTKGKNQFSFEPPSDLSGLKDALNSVNEEDRDRIKQFYTMLTIPDELQSHEDGAGLMPWSSVTFDHAPIVAAASMLTSLKLDIKNAESLASDFLLSKVNAPIFDFNKIEPMTFASSGYINQGDSLALNVMIAAYDSNAVTKIRYGVDADTLVENWKETTGALALKSTIPGQHKVKGAIGVKERGETVWKPWNFNYTVGQPMGVISMPKRMTLYRGYDNIIEGTASGFPPEKITLSGNGCTLRRNGRQWFAEPNRGVRTATVSVIGEKEDGSRVNLGSNEFKVRDVPTPNLYYGNINASENPTVSLAQIRAQRRLSLRYGPEIELTGVVFRIAAGEVDVSNLTSGGGKVNSGGIVDQRSLNIIRQSRGKRVTFIVYYNDPGGKRKRAGGIITVR